MFIGAAFVELFLSVLIVWLITICPQAAKIRFAVKTVNDFFEIRDNKLRFRIEQYVLTGF